MPKQPVSGQGTTEVKSPGGGNKKNLDFNFEDAWKAENKPAQQSGGNQANRNPMNNPMNNPPPPRQFEKPI
jgi:hypothetical protein